MSRSVEEALRVLGVAAGSDPETVAQAYRRRARDTHPDVSADPDAARRFATVVAAYRLLSARKPEPAGEPGDAAVPPNPWPAPAGADDRKPGQMAKFGGSPLASARTGRQVPIVAGPVMVRASRPARASDKPNRGDG